LTSRANHAYRNDMTAVRPRERKILYPPPSFQAVAGRLSCSTSPLAITSPGFNEAPIKADIVFLPDNRVCRKVTYRLYPTPTQEECLWKRLRLHHILYNGALEERIGAWRHPDRIHISFQDQFGFEHSNLKGRCRHQLKKAIRSRSAGDEAPTKIERASRVRPESSSTD
jgi:hypothetical protein